MRRGFLCSLLDLIHQSYTVDLLQKGLTLLTLRLQYTWPAYTVVDSYRRIKDHRTYLILSHTIFSASLGTRVRSAWLATTREPRLRGGYAPLR